MITPEPIFSVLHFGVSRYFAQVIPTTWLIDAARGVILRGAGWRELWPHALVLWGMGITGLAVSSLKFRKRLT